MNVQGLSWLLLRACGVADQQLVSLLLPLQVQFPTTEQQMGLLFTMLRRSQEGRACSGLVNISDSRSMPDVPMPD